MGIYKYIGKAWEKPKESLGDLWKTRLVAWRQEPVTVRVDRPTRLDRARALGYKAKPGYIVVRQRVNKSARMRPKIKHARRPKTRRHKKVVAISYQQIAERRANRKFLNCEVLNSYWVANDGQFKWYEIILVDKAHPSIMADKNISWIMAPQHMRRAFRGLTSAARKSRGLLNKGKGAEKVRPSLRANGQRAH